MASESPQELRRRHRTKFGPEQLEILKFVFTKNKSPDSETIQQLASVLSLDETVVKTWFKNQRVKEKQQQQQQQQQQMQPSVSPGEASQMVFEEEQGDPLPGTSASAGPLNFGHSDGEWQEPDHAPVTLQPGGASAPGFTSTQDSETHIEQIWLGDPRPPWASLLKDINEFIKLYLSFEDGDDHYQLEQYLYPGCLD